MSKVIDTMKSFDHLYNTQNSLNIQIPVTKDAIIVAETISFDLGDVNEGYDAWSFILPAEIGLCMPNLKIINLQGMRVSGTTTFILLRNRLAFLSQIVRVQ